MHMKELDLLKKNWNNSHVLEQVSEIEIYKIVQKKSSSIVKWIFIVSIFEFCLGLFLNFGLSFSKYEDAGNALFKKWGVYHYMVEVTVVLYVITLFFMYRFYKMYQHISNTDSIKNLIQSILNTRKVVKQYIGFNLVFFGVFMLVIFGFTFYQTFLDLHVQSGSASTAFPAKYIAIAVVFSLVLTGFFLIAAWLFYRIIYGSLLKKLSRNYDELVRLDFD